MPVLDGTLDELLAGIEQAHDALFGGDDGIFWADLGPVERTETLRAVCEAFGCSVRQQARVMAVLEDSQYMRYAIHPLGAADRDPELLGPDA